MAGNGAPSIETAVAALRAGELVAFPTETVYGLGADAANPRALERIFALKQRPRSHPLIVHLAGAHELPRWARDVPGAAKNLAAHFWPGPLTLVLRRANGISDLLTGGQPTVAVRVPAHPIAQALLSAFGRGIAAPSANRYGHVSPTCAAHVRDEFGAELPMVLDGGDCALGLESTIVDCSDGAPRLLRPGSIGLRALRERLPDLVSGATAQSPRVPGSTLAHYAPRTPLSLVSGERLEERIDELDSIRGTGVLAMQPAPHWAHRAATSMPGPIIWIDGSGDPIAYAHDLYANLRTLDNVGCANILVQMVPNSEEWDAIRDRLARAAHSSDNGSDADSGPMESLP